MKQPVSWIVRIQAALGGLSALAVVVTGLYRDWIEQIFHVDPDHHSGSVELNITVVAFAFTSTVFVMLAARNRRKSPQA